MIPRHEAAPAVLLHFSEDSTIERFVPHVPATNPTQPPLVWTVDPLHQALYWFPRSCPRVTWWRGPETTKADADRWLGRFPRVHVLERTWRARLSACGLHTYAFDPAPFVPWPDADGYWVSSVEVTPRDCGPTGDLVQRHAAAGIDLRVVEDLRPVWDEVIRTTLAFSGCRLPPTIR